MRGHQKFAKDTYFNGDVVLIYRLKASITVCKVIVFSDIQYIWKVEIIGLMIDAEMILEELKKDEYINEGSSCTF